MDNRAPMISITTSSSISVKPAWRSPVMVGNSVESLARIEGVDVEYVWAWLWVFRRALVATHAPGVFRGRAGVGVGRTPRPPPQEVQVEFFFAGDVLNACG